MKRISLRFYPQVQEELANPSASVETAFADILCLQMMAFGPKTLLEKLSSLFFGQKENLPFEGEIRKILANPQNRMSISVFYRVDVLIVEVQFFAKDDDILNKVEFKYFDGKREDRPLMSFFAGMQQAG